MAIASERIGNRDYVQDTATVDTHVYRAPYHLFTVQVLSHFHVTQRNSFCVNILVSYEHYITDFLLDDVPPSPFPRVPFVWIQAVGEGTLRLSNMKADIGSELWLMQSSLDEARRRDVLVLWGFLRVRAGLWPTDLPKPGIPRRCCWISVSSTSAQG